uniref:Uncharacterized protein n=1 Tax=Kalanchoe fedtschenkoi TaxID=63787 RepID=A0A7N0UFB9_KALFE
MVEISGHFMIFGLQSTTARAQSAPSSAADLISSAVALPLSSASSFSFGSCKEGWYYRCIGVDP